MVTGDAANYRPAGDEYLRYVNPAACGIAGLVGRCTTNEGPLGSGTIVFRGRYRLSLLPTMDTTLSRNSEHEVIGQHLMEAGPLVEFNVCACDLR